MDVSEQMELANLGQIGMWIVVKCVMLVLVNVDVGMSGLGVGNGLHRPNSMDSSEYKPIKAQSSLQAKGKSNDIFARSHTMK